MSKFLRTTFVLSIEVQDVDNFLINKIRKRIMF